MKTCSKLGSLFVHRGLLPQIKFVLKLIKLIYDCIWPLSSNEKDFGIGSNDSSVIGRDEKVNIQFDFVESSLHIIQVSFEAIFRVLSEVNNAPFLCEVVLFLNLDRFFVVAKGNTFGLLCLHDWRIYRIVFAEYLTPRCWPSHFAVYTSWSIEPTKLHVVTGMIIASA